MVFYFVWVKGPRKPEAQVWDDFFKPQERQRSVIKKTLLSELDEKLTLTQLMEKYPLPPEPPKPPSPAVAAAAPSAPSKEEKT